MADPFAEIGLIMHPDAGSTAHAAGVEDKDNRAKLSQILVAIADDETRERIAIIDLLAAMRDRALAALLLVFALPNVLPTPPGTSAVLGTPLVILAAQLMLGRAPWLPRFISRRSMSRDDFGGLIRRAVPWLAKAESLLRPRLPALIGQSAERIVGVVCFLLSVILILPIPLGNMLPALAICLFSLGIIERDGVWILAGIVTALAAIGLVWGVFFALIKSAIFIFARAFG